MAMFVRVFRVSGDEVGFVVVGREIRTLTQTRVHRDREMHVECFGCGVELAVPWTTKVFCCAPPSTSKHYWLQLQPMRVYQ